jgi:hypothetical protein
VANWAAPVRAAVVALVERFSSKLRR